MFLVKKANRKMPCKILYLHPCDIRATRTQKFDFLQDTPFEKMEYLFQEVEPDKNGNWINLTDNDFDTLLPLIDKNSENALFELNSLGVASHRDSWVYDFSKKELQAKIDFFATIYNQTIENENYIDKNKIAWDADLTNYAKRKIIKKVETENFIRADFRPFTKKYFYFDKHFNSRLYQFQNIFKMDMKIPIPLISVNRGGNNKDFHILMANGIVDLHFTGDSQCLPLFVYNKNGEKQDNITDWALEQFRQHYDNQTITKEIIFYYVYAVLHAPAYRAKYEQNLKRDFPRIPLYENIDFYAEQGRKLADLHLHYENAAPYNLRRVDNPPKVVAGVDFVPKAKLKADKTNHCIEIDEITKLYDVPEAAWLYKLGNRSALEWVLDQYKESKPTDKTIATQFNTYRFADYKEKVIELLQRVCRVSVETMQIISGL
jgi:predicted helicase